MLVRRLNLRDFRNIPFASLAFASPREFFLGPNGQGKSNLLEALGLLTALRSFRAAENASLIRHQQESAALFFEVELESEGPATLEIRLGRPQAQLEVNGRRIPSLGDFVGRFPAVALSSSDLNLPSGSPADRRRFLDLTLTASRPGYLAAWRRYRKGLDSRNRLLREPNPHPALFEAFETEMALAAAELVQARTEGLAHLAHSLAQSYDALSGVPESPELAYRPDKPWTDPGLWHAHWREQRPRDLLLGSTRHGPQRDDWSLRLLGQSARSSASEGQKRGLVLALRLAQFHRLHQASGVLPILLADDVLGELDPDRRARFWAALPPGVQVFATGTQPPDGASSPPWHTWSVAAGSFTP